MEESGSDAREAYNKRLLEAQQARQAELQRRSLLQKLLEPAAFDRLANIRLSNNELYEQLVSTLAYLSQKGALRSRVSEDQLKQLAAKIIGQRREPTIQRK